MLSLFMMFAAPTAWNDVMRNEEDKDAVMQQSGVVSERAVEDKERQNNSQRNVSITSSTTPHLCKISLLLLPWVTCNKSAASLPSYILVIYMLSAADPTEVERSTCWCPPLFSSGEKKKHVPCTESCSGPSFVGLVLFTHFYLLALPYLPPSG